MSFLVCTKCTDGTTGLNKTKHHRSQEFSVHMSYRYTRLPVNTTGTHELTVHTSYRYKHKIFCTAKCVLHNFLSLYWAHQYARRQQSEIFSKSIRYLGFNLLDWMHIIAQLYGKLEKLSLSQCFLFRCWY